MLVFPDLTNLVLIGALRALEYLLFDLACLYPAPGLRCEH